VPGLALMENAQPQLSKRPENKFGEVANKRALVICGRGNNGGDARRSPAAS